MEIGASFLRQFNIFKPSVSSVIEANVDGVVHTPVHLLWVQASKNATTDNQLK